MVERAVARSATMGARARPAMSSANLAATPLLTHRAFRRPSMACSKAMDLSYNVSCQHDAESHQGLSCASNFLCKDKSAATPLPTQAFSRTTDDTLRAQTSQGGIRMRSGAKNRAQEGESTSSGLETEARWRPWSASPCFLSACN